MNDSKNVSVDVSANSVTINGVEYVRRDAAATPAGTRALIVVDRGWVFAGDVTMLDGRIKLSRAVWCFSWNEIGLDGMIADPKSKKVTLKPMPNGVDIPADSEIFRIPVSDTWGL